MLDPDLRRGPERPADSVVSFEVVHRRCGQDIWGTWRERSETLYAVVLEVHVLLAPSVVVKQNRVKLSLYSGHLAPLQIPVCESFRLLVVVGLGLVVEA